MSKPEQSAEDTFRSSLEDAVAILEKMSPLCGSVEELVGMLRLALQNNGQLALLIDKVSPVRLRR